MLLLLLDKSIITFISGIQLIASQLKDLGETVNDSQIMARILFSLPKSLEHFPSAWDSTPQDLKTLTLLSSRLVKAENFRDRSREGEGELTSSAFVGASSRTVESSNDQSSESGQQHAYAAGGYPALRGGFNSSALGRGGYRGRGGHHQRGGYHPYSEAGRESPAHSPRYQGEGNYQPRTCYHCGKEGHVIRNCHKLKREKESQQNGGKQHDGQQQFFSLKSSEGSDHKR